MPYKVWLPWASYFVGGVAFHESPDVPTQPASHGCVRVPPYDAKWLYDHAPIGTAGDRARELPVRVARSRRAVALALALPAGGGGAADARTRASSSSASRCP